MGFAGSMKDNRDRPSAPPLSAGCPLDTPPADSGRLPLLEELAHPLGAPTLVVIARTDVPLLAGSPLGAPPTNSGVVNGYHGPSLLEELAHPLGAPPLSPTAGGPLALFPDGCCSVVDTRLAAPPLSAGGPLDTPPANAGRPSPREELAHPLGAPFLVVIAGSAWLPLSAGCPLGTPPANSGVGQDPVGPFILEELAHPLGAPPSSLVVATPLALLPCGGTSCAKSQRS